MPELTTRAKALFAAHNRYPGPALANHNLRIGAFAEALGGPTLTPDDRDLLWAACWLHDVGLLIPDRSEPCYQKRSWNFVAPHAVSWGLEGERAERLRWMLRYTHSIKLVPGLDPSADLIRRAVQVEHSHGLIAHGLPRDQVRAVFARHPWAGLTSILVDFARITLLEDGLTQLASIFLPGKEFS